MAGVGEGGCITTTNFFAAEVWVSERSSCGGGVEQADVDMANRNKRLDAKVRFILILQIGKQNNFDEGGLPFNAGVTKTNGANRRVSAFVALN